MKKTFSSLLTSIFFLFFQVTFGQNKQTDIDKLDGKDEVESYFHSLDKKYEKFELKNIGEFNGKRTKNNFCKRISDSLKITETYYKSDFDNNGLTDILAIGDYYNFNILIALNFGEDSIKVKRLTRRIFQDCVFPKIINDTIIDYYYKTQSNRNTKEKAKLERKSLIYKFGDFIELNENLTDNEIEKIEFQTSKCFGTCPKFKLTINKDRKAEFNAENYNRKTRDSKVIQGEFRTEIKQESYSEIINLLNYINFPNLKENYAVSWTDDQSSILKITYDNGKQKEIKDYGMIGTYGLDRLYELLFELRFNQNWKK